MIFGILGDCFGHHLANLGTVTVGSTAAIMAAELPATVIHMIEQLALVSPLHCHSSLDCMIRSGTTFINAKMEVGGGIVPVNLRFEVMIK
jgi:hypothetical protein